MVERGSWSKTGVRKIAVKDNSKTLAKATGWVCLFSQNVRRVLPKELVQRVIEGTHFGNEYAKVAWMWT